tara:strand:+ start:33268 stop:33771 length:504 start_codon:yes stop_codon:yes gene_type:complete
MEFQELLKKQLTKVPPQIGHYLESDAYPQVMRSVIEKYKLHLDTAQKVETETTLLLIGLVPPNEYEQKLVEKAGVPKEQARMITKDMNDQVFKPLVESYKKPAPVHTNAFADEPAVQKQPEPTPTPVEKVGEPEIPTQIPVETPPAPVEEKKIEKKYAIDPYREPIE